MKKILYVIPGWQDTGEENGYKNLGKAAFDKGYDVKSIKVDWTKPLSIQTFEAPKNSTIFGFSLGAILARLIAQKTECEHIILASMTPDYSFKDEEILKALIEMTGKEFVDDIMVSMQNNNRALKQTVIYGDKENEPGDIIVPDTDHEITENYITEIVKIL